MSEGYKDIEWLGDSVEVVRDFPKAVRATLGSDLYRLQRGEQPIHRKSMTTVGRGVWELRAQASSNAYRVIYVIKKRDKIYVLHAFQKKTQRTAKKDIDLAKQRLKEI